MLLPSAIIGLCIGSFINALVWRVAHAKTLGGRSMCVHCKKQLRNIDLIPVVSFFILKGKCRFCQKKISWQYPIVEIITAVAFVFVTTQDIGPGMIHFQWIILTLLITLFVVDFQYGILPDVLTLPAIATVVVLRLVMEPPLSVVGVDMILGGLTGFSFFALQWIISRGKWIGDGDIRFGVLMGVLLGFPGVLLALLLSYSIGSFFAMGLLATHKRQWESRIALGPFLVIGTLITYYGGERILSVLGL